ncbi:MAG: ATP-binding protein [Desulfobaccales bacterium]
MAEPIYTREDLRSLVQVTSLVNSSLDTQEALDNALKGVEQMLDAEVSSIFEVDPAKGELFFSLARGTGADRIKTLRLKIGEGIAGWVAQTEKPLICADTSRDPRFFKQFDAWSGFQTRSILCVPLKSRDRLIGVLEVLNKNSPAGFTDEDLEIMTIMGNLIGPALENARLYSRLKEKLSLTMEDLKVAEQKLLQSERLAALGKLSQGVAHEVRNPVMVIGGFVRRFQRGLAADDPAQEVAGLILGEINRLERMVAEIEAFAATPLPDLKPRDLVKLVDQVLADTAGALEARQITVERRLAPDLPLIPLDERLLGEALRLLIDNAMDAMAAGGRLTVEVAPEPQGLRLTVRDTGTGIPPEDIPYLFDPFFSSKPQGTGMGLTKVHQVVSDHHGEIRIDSAPGQGAEVNMWLPRWQAR